MSKEELVKAVKEYALRNYERGGWDYIIECYMEAELLELIGNARTVQGAIRNVRYGSGIGVRAAYRKDIQGA
jgi:hypothetical protein